MMKKLLFISVMLLTTFISYGQYSATVYKPVKPVVINRPVNIVLEVRVSNETVGSVLNAITIDFAKSSKLEYINDMSVYYTGTMSARYNAGQGMSIRFGEVGGGQQVFTDPSYAIFKSRVNNINRQMTFVVEQPLVLGDNYMFIGLSLKPDYPLTELFDLKVSKVLVNNRVVDLRQSGLDMPFRAAINVRDAGDDGVHSYRIPSLVTAVDGSLLAAYDVRRNNSVDLQENVQVGLSRSMDKGQSWLPMQIIMDQRGVDGLPDSQNGVGDPALLVDDNTGDIYAMALWTHGIGVNRAWWGVTKGLDYRRGAAQVLVVKSSDNGATWSKPHNITSQIKDSTWYILLQGPGRGIAMRDGTLVFPFQYVDSARMPHATIVYSKDKGETWTVGTPARSNTTEAQVVELPTGELMLNMRDNRGEFRAVLTTTDMGMTWSEHSSSRNALQEPVCMGSLIEVPADKNVLGRDILLFSNPDNKKSRTHITIKASLDNGVTWLPENQVLLDEEMGWGYSCLTMVDKSTVGVLYESSVGQMTFQEIPLIQIIKK